jgi:hypothetical protein
MSDVGEHRRRCEVSRRQRWFSVLWSGGGAQEAEERRKKKTVWGKRRKLTPAPIFIPRDQGRGGRGSPPLPRPFLRKVAMWRHGVGRRFL